MNFETGITSTKTVRRRASGFLICVLLALGISPAMAQIDLTGVWTVRIHEDWPEIGPGAGYGNFMGLPINEDARARGLAWHPSLQNVPEHQCVPVTPEYGDRWSHQKIWSEQDPVTGEVIAWHLQKSWQQQVRTFWMDGREPPPEGSPHTFQGFSTAEWQGNTLVIKTSRLKEGPIRRNGIQHSDKAELIEHFIRHGDYLTISVITHDPIYFTEPMIHSSVYVKSLVDEVTPYPCEVVTEITTQEKHYIPHFLPGSDDINSRVEEDRLKRGVRLESWLGGAKTMYPEYIFELYPDYKSKSRPNSRR